MGEAMATMAAAFARLERRRISERSREAIEAKRPELRTRRLRILELATDEGLSQRAIAALKDRPSVRRMEERWNGRRTYPRALTCSSCAAPPS